MARYISKDFMLDVDRRETINKNEDQIPRCHCVKTISSLTLRLELQILYLVSTLMQLWFTMPLVKRLKERCQVLFWDYASRLSNHVCFVCVVWQLGNFIHYMATFVSGFVVGFTAVWQLALVTLAMVPLIAIIGAIHNTTLANLSSKSQEALSEAENNAWQTIARIRIVLAYVGDREHYKPTLQP